MAKGTKKKKPFRFCYLTPDGQYYFYNNLEWSLDNLEPGTKVYTVELKEYKEEKKCI